jgi:hypothetical protein
MKSDPPMRFQIHCHSRCARVIAGVGKFGVRRNRAISDSTGERDGPRGHPRPSGADRRRAVGWCLVLVDSPSHPGHVFEYAPGHIVKPIWLNLPNDFAPSAVVAVTLPAALTVIRPTIRCSRLTAILKMPVISRSQLMTALAIARTCRSLVPVESGGHHAVPVGVRRHCAGTARRC